MQNTMEDRTKRFGAGLLTMDAGAARRLITDAQGAFLPLEEAETLIVSALERIGQGWESGTVALSQVYMSGRQCENLMKEFRPESLAEHTGNVRMAIVVLEDYHFLGMRLVSSVLKASGFSPLDFGRMDVDALVRRVVTENIDLLLVSVLMLRSALRVRDLRAKLGASGRRVILAVGGAPFRLDKELWRDVGADGSSDTAAGAVALVKRLSAECAR